MQFAFNRPVYGPMLPSNPVAETFYVSNTTNPGEGQGSPGPTAQGRSPRNPFTTIAAAITEAVGGRGDTIIIQRGTYTENLAVNKAGTHFRSAQPMGYPDHVVIVGRTVVTVAGVTFYGIEFFSNDGGLPSVRLGSDTQTANTLNSLWFENCSFASDGTTEPEAGVLIYGGSNIMFRKCYFVDNTFGVNIHSTQNERGNHLMFDRCNFAENTTADLSTAAGGFDATVAPRVGTTDVGINFLMVDCTHSSGATAPTTFITIGGGGGLVASCRFATATNASAVFSIPAAILWSSNMTEAGVSTARPA